MKSKSNNNNKKRILLDSHLYSSSSEISDDDDKEESPFKKLKYSNIFDDVEEEEIAVGDESFDDCYSNDNLDSWKSQIESVNGVYKDKDSGSNSYGSEEELELELEEDDSNDYDNDTDDEEDEEDDDNKIKIKYNSNGFLSINNISKQIIPTEWWASDDQIQHLQLNYIPKKNIKFHHQSTYRMYSKFIEKDNHYNQSLVTWVFHFIEIFGEEKTLIKIYLELVGIYTSDGVLISLFKKIKALNCFPNYNIELISNNTSGDKTRYSNEELDLIKYLHSIFGGRSKLLQIILSINGYQRTLTSIRSLLQNKFTHVYKTPYSKTEWLESYDQVLADIVHSSKDLLSLSTIYKSFRNKINILISKTTVFRRLVYLNLDYIKRGLYDQIQNNNNNNNKNKKSNNNNKIKDNSKINKINIINKHKHNSQISINNSNKNNSNSNNKNSSKNNNNNNNNNKNNNSNNKNNNNQNHNKLRWKPDEDAIILHQINTTPINHRVNYYIILDKLPHNPNIKRSIADIEERVYILLNK